MSDVTETDEVREEPGHAVTVVRERLVARSDVAVWDTADFEHMGRVAVTMAESGLMNDTFLKDGEAAASRNAIVARCLLVASVARECGANPLVFLQHCAIIARKIHFEGKLVNAIVRARTGVNLRFRFGVWDTDHIEFPPEGATDESFFHGVGDRLAVRCFDPADPERYVDGSVGQWKTDRKGSPWSSPANWRRQLRYRAAPEWARAYEPGAILGINSDAEGSDEPEWGSIQSAPLAPLHSGFEDAKPEPVKPPRRGPKAKADPGGKDAAPEAEPVLEAEVEEIVAEVPAAQEEPEERALEAGPQPEAEEEEREEDPGPEVPPQLVNMPIAEGYPEEDEIHFLNGDEWFFDPRVTGYRRETYKNGEPFSTAGNDKGYKIYEDHAPEGAAAPEAEAAAGEDEPLDPNDPIDRFIMEMEEAKTWAGVLESMKWFFPSEEFKALSPEEQHAMRRTTWECAEGVDGLPDHAQDPQAFRLWIEAQDDADAITGTLAVLEHAEAFTILQPGSQDGIRRAAAGRVEALKG